jgi:hypothetical protein
MIYFNECRYLNEKVSLQKFTHIINDLVAANSQVKIIVETKASETLKLNRNISIEQFS